MFQPEATYFTHLFCFRRIINTILSCTLDHFHITYAEEIRLALQEKLCSVYFRPNLLYFRSLILNLQVSQWYSPASMNMLPSHLSFGHLLSFSISQNRSPLFINFLYYFKDFFCDLRDDRISKSFESGSSVQPSGYPIIHSTKAGCNLKPVALPIWSLIFNLGDFAFQYLSVTFHPPTPSDAEGVFSILCFVLPNSTALSRVSLPFVALPPFQSLVELVGNNPNSISSVGRIDGNSWYNKRLYFVAFFFQVSTHLFENHTFVPSSESRNIFSNDPSWSENRDALKHLRPEVAVVSRSLPSSGLGKWLAREPPP